ncbi:hypothetical protein FHY55_06060 [Oceanicola sp. D3]|uniref:hypothetical protein n=1 Tax=Oceanicola sp. D3 TaxID=2587163 RepID=UPI001120B43A|nr:hypothetical protein [Oceanicola sp. D3]QDC08830.1 hypothetical protein FHY55_06060 [Oceanicola sp. D3]
MLNASMRFPYFFVMNYLALCFGGLIAVPLTLPLLFFTFGLGFPFIPLTLYLGAFLYPAFVTPAIFSGLSYGALVLNSYRRVRAGWAVPLVAVGTVLVAYVLFVTSAELNWRWLMAREADRNGLENVDAKEVLAVRFWRANLGLHSDERMYYSPHATARKDGLTYIWSFSESRFVAWPGHRRMP